VPIRRLNASKRAALVEHHDRGSNRTSASVSPAGDGRADGEGLKMRVFPRKTGEKGGLGNFGYY
jgi:hypothetical protein